ncbi:hypothetical protein XCR_4111 [Xanthomonas campestris pv. raphani 756C]|nr:hypothetical protein XCR_4111 [Xanthomonas campestris pv. raphani 756C]
MGSWNHSKFRHGQVSGRRGRCAEPAILSHRPERFRQSGSPRPRRFSDECAHQRRPLEPAVHVVGPLAGEPTGSGSPASGVHVETVSRAMSHVSRRQSTFELSM